MSTLRDIAARIALEIEQVSAVSQQEARELYAEKVRYGMSLALLQAHYLTVLRFRELRKRQDGSCAVIDELAKLIKAELHELEKQGPSELDGTKEPERPGSFWCPMCGATERGAGGRCLNCYGAWRNS